MKIKFTERKIICAQMKGRYKQFFLSLPKQFAEPLYARGIKNLLIICDGVLIAIPAETVNEDKIATSLQAYKELQNCLAKLDV